MRAATLISVLSGLLATCASAAAAPARQMILTGSDKALWLVRIEGTSFDLVVKPAGGKWKWLGHQLSGTPVAAAAGPRLHLLLRGGGHLVFGTNRDDQMTGDNLDGSPVAACGASDFADQPGPSIIAIVRQSAAGGPASRPRSRPAATGSRPTELVRLAAYQNVEGEWKPLPDAEWGDVPLAGDGAVFAAVLGKSLYVLVSNGPGGGNHLYAWDQAEPNEIPLTGPAASRRALAMLALRDRVAVLLTEPVNPAGTMPAADSARASLLIASSHDPGRRFPETCQPVTRDGSPATWLVPSAVEAHAPGAPLAARLADHVALVWQEGKDLKFATCDVNGRLNPGEDLDVFQQPPVRGQAQDIIEYFLYAVMIAIVLVFISRPAVPVRPLTLPPNLRPASLLKRLVALLIDLMPFMFVGTIVFLPDMVVRLPRTREEFTEVFEQHRDSPTAAYMMILSLGLYTAYCVLMEWRFGATLGKMIFHLRIAGAEGKGPHLRQTALRNLWRLIELMVLQPFPVLLLVPLLTRLRQRLGDVLSHTAVVEPATRLLPPISPGSPPPSEGGDQEGQNRPPRNDEQGR